MTESAISARDRDAVLTSLRSGVVPRRGIHLVQVGRAAEVTSLVKDIDRIAEGGGAIRFCVGTYGSGKSFLLSLVQTVALERGIVTLSADLNPDRRLQGTGGQARSLYAELTRNMATRTKSEGGAIASVVERFVSTAMQESKASAQPVEAVIRARLASLAELVNGYDFGEVIACYWRGHSQGDDQLKQSAIRWLRGEFSTRTDARNALGVRAIVDDDSVYDQLKLLARFVRLAGYKGLLICLDELVNLFKIPNSMARKSNYEQILRIFNDIVQGNVEGLGVLFGATPETLLDPSRGLYSYPALQSRLSENEFAKQAGVSDVGGPVINLANLTPEDIYVLLTKLRLIQASGNADRILVPDEALTAFLQHCQQRIGAAYFQTPRNSIRAFLDVLSVLEQHPELHWKNLIETAHIHAEAPSDDVADEASRAQASSTAPSKDDDLTTFRL
jgi:hypothetical protein